MNNYVLMLIISQQVGFIVPRQNSFVGRFVVPRQNSFVGRFVVFPSGRQNLFNSIVAGYCGTCCKLPKAEFQTAGNKFFGNCTDGVLWNSSRAVLWRAAVLESIVLYGG